jgi:hypothetical protein
VNNDIKTTAEAEEAATLAGLHEVHADPNARNAAKQPMPKAMTRKSAQKKSPAQWAYERMILYIRNFEEQLDASQEVAMGFAGGDAGVLRIEGMGYFDPDIVTFYGVDSAGSRTQLVQHVSQLSVLLRALPKPKEKAEPTRIGFRLVEELDKSG